jgi:hypothetical protein
MKNKRQKEVEELLLEIETLINEYEVFNYDFNQYIHLIY